MATILDMLRGWRDRLQAERDPGLLLATAGAVLLIDAPLLPGISRLVVLPALLLAPGYAFLRLLGQATGIRSISIAVPVSLVLAICASLVLGVIGIRLGPLSLGPLLGAVTALFLVGSYRRLGGSWPASLKPPPPQQPAPALQPPPPPPPPPARQPPPPKLGPWGEPDFTDTEPIPVITEPIPVTGDPKDLWPDAGEGWPINGSAADSEHARAAFVAEEPSHHEMRGHGRWYRLQRGWGLVRGLRGPVSPGSRPGGRPSHGDVVLTATDDHPAAAKALRAMFTRDFLYLGVSALQVVLAALITPILTRRVGVGQFGQLALAVVVAQLLGVIFSFGLPFAAQKLFAGEDGDRRSRGILAISAVLAAATSLVVVLAAPAWGPAVGLNSVLDARLAALWGASFALTWTTLAMLRSRDRLRMAIFVAALQSVGAQAAGVLLLYSWSPTITNYLWGLIIGQGAAAFLGLLALRPDWSALAAIRRYAGIFLFGLPMVPQELSGWILGVGDRVVIRHDLGSVAVGRYSVAYNVGSLGFILLVFVTQAWMPRIYALADRVARSQLLASSRDMMNLLLIPVVCGLAAGAPVVLEVWVPESFHPAELTPIVAIIAICTFPFAQFVANLRALMSEDKTARAAVATLVAAAVNIGLNIVMVPFLGITGSAIATVLSYALCARLTRPPVSSGLQVPGASALLRTLIGGAVVATLAIGVLPTSPVWLAIRVVMGAGALLAFAFLLRRAMTGFEPSGRLDTLVGGNSTKVVT
jgi:O-antigen/teichoic acid export membrane protein